MSEDVESESLKPVAMHETTGPWKKFLQLVTEPWTAILLLASTALFVIGQRKLDPSVTALIQILLAVASGVLGARVTNLLESASGKSIIEARGKVAVRGLKLMLVQTAAFQGRIQRFIDNRQQIESNPDLTVRNYEEAIEFCRRIQEEAASAMETWADVVPTADLSSIIGRITEAEEQRDASKRQLEHARGELETAAGDAKEAERMRERIGFLEERYEQSQRRVRSLTKALDQPATSALTSSAVSNALLGIVPASAVDTATLSNAITSSASAQTAAIIAAAASSAPTARKSP